MPWIHLAPWWLVPLVSGLLMLSDYQLTLIAARPAQRAGLLYELNPLLRRDVARQRTFSPRFVLGTCVVVLALVAVHLMAGTAFEFAIYEALVGGIIATRGHLIFMHLRNMWRHRTARVPRTVPNAMLQVAYEQTACAAGLALLTGLSLPDAFHNLLLGGAVGFLLMAMVTLVWRQRELRLAHAAAGASETPGGPRPVGRSI